MLGDCLQVANQGGAVGIGGEELLQTGVLAHLARIEWSANRGLPPMTGNQLTQVVAPGTYHHPERGEYVLGAN